MDEIDMVVDRAVKRAIASTVSITEENGKLYVESPYNPDYVKRAKNLGGRWNADRRCWVFDARAEADVRALLADTYGTTGEEGEEEDLVTVEIELLGNWYGARSSLFYAGRPIARAFGRDSGAKLGEGVMVLDGDVTSGGSMKNWATFAKKGTKFRIYDCPRALVEEGEVEVGRGSDTAEAIVKIV